MSDEEYFEQLCSNSIDGTLTDSEREKLEAHLAAAVACLHPDKSPVFSLGISMIFIQISYKPFIIRHAGYMLLSSSIDTICAWRGSYD